MREILRALAVACLSLALLLSPAAVGQGSPPLSERGLANLVAFTRLVSLVRFFHPSDEAAAADWNRVAVAGVEAVESARDAEALAAVLESFFQPLAPSLRVFPSGSRPVPAPELTAPAEGAGLRIVAWRHFGGRFGGRSKIYRSERIDSVSPLGFGTLAQAVAAEPFRGRRVRLRARVRTALEPGGRAELGLRVDRAGGEPGFFERARLDSGVWTEAGIEGEVAADAEQIAVILVLTGGGRAWIDEVSLAGADGGPTVALANPGFEIGEPGRQPRGWAFPYESISAGYHLVLRRGEPCFRGGCAEVASDAIATPRFPSPDESPVVELGGGVAALVPRTLYADERGTLPHRPAVPAESPPARPWDGVDAQADTRAARLAAVALAWGIAQHLHPWLDTSSPEWAVALPAALARAAEAADREAFSAALERLLVPLSDLRATVRLRGHEPSARLPVAWDWVEGRLVVTGVEGVGEVRVGDLVTTLDGRPAEQVVMEREARTSGRAAAARRAAALEHLAWDGPGSEVRLGLERAGSGPLEVSLPRREELLQVPDTSWPAVAEPRPGVLYLDLRRLAQPEVEALLPRLVEARGVVFDLRGDTEVSTVLLSHLARNTAASSNWQVPVVLQPDHAGLEWLTSFWKIEPREPHVPARLAFLVDARAAGYTETLLAMIEHYRWGELVGSPSAGENGTPNWSDLPAGCRFLWTGQRVLKHDGSPFHGVGARPTLPAARTLAGLAAGRDEVLERALDAVSEP